MPETTMSAHPLLTKTKTRTKIGVATLTLIVGAGLLATVGNVLSSGMVCNSGSRIGQSCRSNLDCRVRSADSAAICVSARTLPDLVVRIFSVAERVDETSGLYVIGEIRNQGTGLAAFAPSTATMSTRTVRFEFLDALGNVLGSGEVMRGIGVKIGIPAGGREIIRYPLANVPAGTTAMRIMADPDNLVAESNETNNSSSGNIRFPSVTGELSARLSGSSPVSNIITGGSSNIPVLDVEFTAVGEAFTVRKLRLKNDRAEDSEGISNLIIRYPQADGTTAERTGVLVGTQADFNGLTFYVPRDSRALLQVLVNTLPVTAAGVSGDTPQFSLDIDENFEAFGNSSWRTISSVGSADITGQEMVLHKTKPTVTLSVMSPSGARASGLDEVLRFMVSADRAGDVVLDGLTFQVTSTDNAASGWNVNGNPIGNIDLASAWSLYEANDAFTPLESGDSDWTLFGAGVADGTLSATETIGYARLMFTTPRTIAAGTSKVFVLKVDTTGASGRADDTVRFDILGENGSTNMTLTALTEFQWDEVGAGAATDINGSLIRMLPITGGVITY